MKISPMASTSNAVSSGASGGPAQTPIGEKLRSLRMKTNVTPGIEEVLPPAADPEVSIPDSSIEKTEAAAEETQPLSPQFAALAKQRRALQQERQALDREKAELSASKKDVPAIDLARLKSDPLGVLLENGIGYDQLTEAVLANQNGYNPKIKTLEDKIASLESGLEKKLTDRDTQAEQAALAEMQREATQLVAQGDDFEMVRETKRVPVVMKLIEKTYRDTGEVLDVREALNLVEEEIIKEGLLLANLKKVQSKIVPPTPVFEQPPQQQRQMRTLTNRDTASVAISRKARALAAFHGTLKK